MIVEHAGGEDISSHQEHYVAHHILLFKAVRAIPPVSSDFKTCYVTNEHKNRPSTRSLWNQHEGFLTYAESVRFCSVCSPSLNSETTPCHFLSFSHAAWKSSQEVYVSEVFCIYILQEEAYSSTKISKI